MYESTDPPASIPVFGSCVRCGYSLRGLPANHACPECGLRFDERCELYRVTNPRQVLAIWLLIFGGGWVSLKNLPYLFDLSTVTGWRLVGALAAACWFPFVGIGVYLLIKRYRRGFEVAVTGDGLIVRLPGFDQEVIPWAAIDRADVKEKPRGKPQVATVLLKAKRKAMDIGGVTDVFPTRGHVERFVRQVNERVRVVVGKETM